MCTINRNRKAVFVVSILFALPLAAQNQPGPGSPSPNTVAVLVNANRPGVLIFDGASAKALTPGEATHVQIPQGRYTFRAATNAGRDYWEEVFIVQPPGPLTIEIDFAAAVQKRKEDEQRLVNLKSEIVSNTQEVQTATGQARELKTRAAELRRVTEQKSKEFLRRVEAIIAKIRDLERKFESYTEQADQLLAQGNEVKAEADRQNSNTTLGALTGLIGNLGAGSIFNDSFRNRMRARGALRRMDQLTGVLTDASDNGFDQLPASPDIPTVFAVQRKGARGELKVTDGRIEYKESLVSSGKKPAKLVNFLASCNEARSIKMDGAGIAIKTQKEKVSVSPVRSSPEDLLAEIFIACPTRDF